MSYRLTYNESFGKLGFFEVVKQFPQTLSQSITVLSSLSLSQNVGMFVYCYTTSDL